MSEAAASGAPRKPENDVIDTYRGLTLDRFQKEAIAGIERNENVIVAAPTGAGKTLIASYAIERALAAGKRAIYTAPIKALSNQKYRDLSEAYPDKVGISTGDVSINPTAPVVIMTTEIFRNTIFDDPQRVAEVGWVIFDEVHFLDDPDRGTVWEECLIFAPPSVKILALSATVSNLDEFASWVREVRNASVQVVLETHRPVPLKVYAASTEGGIRPLEKIEALRLGKKGFRSRFNRRSKDLRAYFEGAQRDLVEAIAEREELPLLFFLFSRASTERLATACSDLDLTASPEAARAAADEFEGLARAFELDLNDPDVKHLHQLAGRGIAYHHAGILPALKEVIERMFTDNHLRLLCATETFALGVNMPARSVAFEGIHKWNGHARVLLKTREFQQMAGRAGRRGIDERGSVFLTYDPFQNHGRLYANVVEGRVEPVKSQFNLSYGTLLNLYERLGDDLYEACERSFANFRARQQVVRGGGRKRRGRSRHPISADTAREKPGKGGRRGRGRDGRGRDGRRRNRRGRRERERESGGEPRPRGAQSYQDIVEQVRIKMEVLAELDYIDAEGQITERGRFAMQVFGHEVEITELVFSRAFDGLEAEQVAVVMAAVVFESRPHVFYGGPHPRRLIGKKAHRLAERALEDLIRLEERRGVRQPCKALDWNLSGVVWEWVQGAEFGDLRELTDASDGDVVRALRQTIQALRLASKPLKAVSNKPLQQRVAAAQRLLKRDLVDAEWQLRRAAELERFLAQESDEGPVEDDAEAESEDDEVEAAEAVEVDPFSEGIL